MRNKQNVKLNTSSSSRKMHKLFVSHIQAALSLFLFFSLVLRPEEMGLWSHPPLVGGGGGGGGGTGGSQSPASRTPFSRLPYVFVPLSPDSRPLLCFSRYHVNHAV